MGSTKFCFIMFVLFNTYVSINSQKCDNYNNYTSVERRLRITARKKIYNMSDSWICSLFNEFN